jgi:serine/threonine-protein kinase
MTEDLLRVAQRALAGRYEIEREIGSGGMATVFLARDPGLDRPVAVKILNPSLCPLLAHERFLREIDLAAKLTHPNIVPVFAAGEVDGLLYYVMPYVAGDSLRRRLARGPIPLPQALSIAAEVAKALQFAHQRSIIHRDIKPENILLSGQHAVVADFGVARAISAAGKATPPHELTEQGVVLGTPRYMSPEQGRGDVEVDGRTDVYGLGRVLAEMVGMDGTNSNPTSLPIPNDVRTLVRRTTATDRDERPSAVQVVAELRRIEANYSGAVPVVGAPSRSRKATWGYAAAIVGAVLALATAGGLIVGERGASPDGPQLLAVLPFEYIGDADLAYFAHGVTEEVTNRLAEVDGLGVISRTSAAQYAEASVPLQRIGQELGVGYLVHGTVRTERRPDGTGRVRVTPELLRLSDNARVWSSQFDIDLEPSDLFRVQGQIADRIAAALDLSLRSGSDAPAPTANLDAYQQYLRGVQLWTEGVVDLNDESRLAAIAAYENAIRLDSTFALAFAKLAGAHSWVYSVFIDRSEDRLDQARRAADRALALSPQLPDAKVALAWYHIGKDRDFDAAERLFAEALATDPNDVDALYGVGYLAHRIGNQQRAFDVFRRRLELDPRSSHAELNLAAVLVLSGSWENAEQHYQRAIQWTPDAYLPRVRLAQFYLTVGDSALAAEAVNTARAVLGREFVVRAANGWIPFLRSVRHVIWPDVEALPRSAYRDSAQYHFVQALAPNTSAADRRAHYDAARQILERRVAEFPANPALRSALGLALAGAGRLEEAVAAGEEAVRLSIERRDALEASLRRRDMAEIYAMAGEVEKARAALTGLTADPTRWPLLLIEADPIWDAVLRIP